MSLGIASERRMLGEMKERRKKDSRCLGLTMETNLMELK